MRRAFFWKGGTAIKGGQCLVQWKVVCRSKEVGGLGILDLENMNMALLAKWWWKLLSGQKKFWRPIVCGPYYSRRKPLKEGDSFRPSSFWWRGVLKTREIFKCGTAYDLGDESKVEWWNDIWYGHTPLRTVYPTIFDKVSNKNRRLETVGGLGGGSGVRFWQGLGLKLMRIGNWLHFSKGR